MIQFLRFISTTSSVSEFGLTGEGTQLGFIFVIFRGRLAHGRHFTFKSIITDSAITLVSSDVIGTSVDENCPYAACGTWLQVCKSWYTQANHIFKVQTIWTYWPFPVTAFVHCKMIYRPLKSVPTMVTVYRLVSMISSYFGSTQLYMVKLFLPFRSWQSWLYFFSRDTYMLPLLRCMAEGALIIIVFSFTYNGVVLHSKCINMPLFSLGLSCLGPSINLELDLLCSFPVRTLLPSKLLHCE